MNFMVIDCETCPVDKDLAGVVASNMFYYDLGWVVVDEYGRVLEAKSYVNADIYIHEKELMKSAYYADKLPMYQKDIDSKKRILAKSYTIRKNMLADISDYSITHVFAHNMRFDHGALNNTQRWLTKSEYRYFFPYGINICDTLKLARKVLGHDDNYKKFCVENEFMTKNNRVRMTAEVIYKYLTRNMSFTESHTGLEDCMIEKDILMYCLRFADIEDALLWKRD